MDKRRRRETDREFATLKQTIVTRLRKSLISYLRDLRSGDPHAQSAFVARHSGLVREGYLLGYRLGQSQYWEHVSRKQWHKEQTQAPFQSLQKLLFYVNSIPKMAVELKSAFEAPTLSDEDAKKWIEHADVRVTLQADISWSGAQDGYKDMALGDPARPYNWIYWTLDPSSRHCPDCPSYAAGSPYGYPGSGQNELNATPGDGSTECGAGCKCDLEYGAGPDTDIADWTPILPANPTLPDYATAPLKIRQPTTPDLSDKQIEALDYFRSAAKDWQKLQQVDLSLPDMGTMFEPDSDFLKQNLTTLTPRQRKVIIDMIDAMKMWQDATGGKAVSDLGVTNDHVARPIGAVKSKPQAKPPVKPVKKTVRKAPRKG